MSNLDDEIRAKTEAFAKDLAVLVRRAAIEAAAAALGMAGGTAAASVTPAAKRGRGRPPKPAVAAPVAKVPAAPKRGKTPAPSKPAASKKPSKERAPGEKRPAAELAKLTEKLGDYIKAHPGQRMEAIGKALGMPTKELNLPIKKLLAAKKIRTQGQKRATEYFGA